MWNLRGEVGLGLLTSSSTPYPDLLRQWTLFDAMGVDSLWLSDHIVKTFQPEAAYRHSWALLPALASHTRFSNLGVLVTSNTFRHPSVLVREIITVDEISQGRLIVGMGAGWYRPEHEIMGVPMPKQPIRALESSLEIITTMLSGAGPHNIKTLDYPPIQHAIIRPQPVGPCPILIGGHGPKMLQVAASWGQIWNSFGTPEEMYERASYLFDLAQSRDRDVERTLYLWRGLLPFDPWDSVDAFEEAMGLYQDCNLDGVIIDAPRDYQMETFRKCLAKRNSFTLQTSTAQ